MADFAITQEKIWPTDADVGVTSGDGNGLFELNMAAWLAKAGQANFCVSGLTLPGSSGSLTVSVAAGVAVIDGRLCTVPNSTVLTASNNTTSYLYLRMDKTSSKAVTVTWELNTTGTPPTDCIPVAVMVSSGGVITTITDCRVTKPSFTGNNRVSIFNVAGTFQFVARTNYVILDMLGGGGGGGGSAAASAGGGGGGGGGGWVRCEYAVTPGKIYTVVVGAAGAAGLSAAAGGNGGDSYFDTNATASKAPGGTGGAGGASGAGGAGGAGTTTSSGFRIPGTTGGSKSGTTGGAAGLPGGFYQPTPLYGAGGVGTTGTSAAVGNIGQAGLVAIFD